MAPRIEDYALLSDMASAAPVLETIFNSDGGEVAVIDCMPVGSKCNARRPFRNAREPRPVPERQHQLEAVTGDQSPVPTPWSGSRSMSVRRRSAGRCVGRGINPGHPGGRLPDADGDLSVGVA